MTYNEVKAMVLRWVSVFAAGFPLFMLPMEWREHILGVSLITIPVFLLWTYKSFAMFLWTVSTTFLMVGVYGLAFTLGGAEDSYWQTRLSPEKWVPFVYAVYSALGVLFFFVFNKVKRNSDVKNENS